jgi:SAM-dependent methyltransferase
MSEVANFNFNRIAYGALRRSRLPAIAHWLRCKLAGRAYVPPAGQVRFGALRRLEPLSRNWGEDRGGPLDRHYMEQFLAAHRADIAGRVLEIGDADQIRAWGDPGRVTHIDVMNLKPGHPETTIVGDLAACDEVPSNSFDCVVLIQTLQLIWDVRAAVRHVHRILKPGGVVLASGPGITPVNRGDSDSWGDYWCWNFTALSMRRLFSEAFGERNVDVKSYGNVLAAAAFLYGMGRGDLRAAELDARDPDYEMLLSVRAVKVA